MAAKLINRLYRLSLVLAIILTVPQAFAAKNSAGAKEVALNKRGQQLEAKYAGMLADLKAEISSALPVIDEQAQAAYAKAQEDEKAADAKLKAAKEAFKQIADANGLVNHAKGKWIGGAKKGIAAAQKKLAEATTDAERQAARAELVKWQQNLADGEQALKERQAKLDNLKRQEPQLKAEVEAAEQALAQANARTVEAHARLKFDSFLSGDALDARLVKYVVLHEATPRGLAAFAQRGPEQEKLVEQLLADDDLMLQMVVADGAAGSDYGRAMEIYTAIQQASDKAGNGVLQRLALAISLEHAVPVKQRNAVGLTDAPATVDPVKRYQHFEQAYLNGELDPGFKGLSVWDYRMVVDGYEPDETLAWGREMLRNYRPDHITTDNHSWRYVAAVRTDIRYGSQDNKHDRDDLQFFQNILMNGGVCGRRAFFGRFILRAFGVPTTARPQRGHAALTRWTPDGWVICLGAGWGHGWTKGRYGPDLDFLATTQAREDRAGYLQVKRAQWIGDVVGEERVFGFVSGDPGFWYSVSLYQQQKVIEASKAKTLAAVGEELGEANESDVVYAIETAEITEADRQVAVSPAGVITVPAAATSKPSESTGKIIFMPSVLGGLQLHYKRNGGPEDFEYSFDAPKAGTYNLTMRVVTPSWQQHLRVTANDSKYSAEIALPHTVGMWETTEPIQVELVEGRNVLVLSHFASGNAKGVTIRDLTLTPAR